MVGKILFSLKHVPNGVTKNVGDFLNIFAIGVRKGSVLVLWINRHEKHSFSNFHLVYGKVLTFLERRWYVAKKESLVGKMYLPPYH